MLWHNLLLLSFGASTLAATTGASPAPDAVDNLAAKGLKNLQAEEKAAIEAKVKSSKGKCTLSKVAVRKSWLNLSLADRKKYTKAVNCLASKPSLHDPAQVPGAKSRYDDFVAVHMMQTIEIHATANFLSWHRYFTWQFEQALRNECGYTGYQPYWPWGRTAADPLNSLMFDGSEGSMSGDGANIGPHDGFELDPGFDMMPPGNGGGCVTSGPFKNFTVNLGPISPTLAGVVPLPFEDFFKHNPRCLKRDINQYISSKWSPTAETVDLITRFRTIESFQNRMQGDFPAGYLGVHSAGHFTMGGDPAGDLFVSPGDPAFWLHHAQIDRVWWIWQNLAPKEERYNVGGTITILNTPPSRNGTLDDTVQMGVIAPELVTLRELMSTTDGPFCYIYL